MSSEQQVPETEYVPGTPGRFVITHVTYENDNNKKVRQALPTTGVANAESAACCFASFLDSYRRPLANDDRFRNAGHFYVEEQSYIRLLNVRPHAGRWCGFVIIW